MKLNLEFLFCGDGGQGLMLLGDILAHSLIIADDTNVLLIKNYGPEARGGTCRSGLIVRNSCIQYPDIVKPDLVLALSNRAYLKYCAGFSDCIMITDDSVNAVDNKQCRFISYPFLDTARNDFGNPQLSNIIALGMITGMCKMFDAEMVLNEIDLIIPRQDMLLTNRRAFDIGYKAAHSLLEDDWHEVLE